MKLIYARSAGMALAAIAFLGLAVFGGCGKQNSRLSNSQGSPEEVCRTVLTALAANDTLGLNRLRLTRFEHDSLLFAESPPPPVPGAVRDVGLAWYMLEQKNIKGIRRALERYGGRRFSFVRVQFTKPDETLGGVLTHKGTEVTVRDSTGAEFVLPIFGSMVEDGNRFKLVSYHD